MTPLQPVRAVVAAALVLAALAAPAPAQDDGNAVVARVDGAEFYLDDLEAVYERLPEQYREMPFRAIYGPMLEQLVASQLAAEEGRRQGLGDDPALRRQVAQYEATLLQRAYLTEYAAARLTDENLRGRYEATLAGAEGEVRITASHILLKTEDEASAVIAELDGGGDFADLAKAHSIGPSAPRGGSLGTFGPGRMVKEFEDAALAIEPGSYGSAPVETRFGWHVILVEGRETAPPQTFEEARARLERELTAELVQAHLVELRGAAEVELFNPDGTPFTPLAPDAGR